MVGDLKKLFDAGLGAGSECDLREFQPDELDPNAVASCFKNWLRSCKFSLPNLFVRLRMRLMRVRNV